MTLAVRKRLVVSCVLLLICLANVSVLVSWLTWIGLIGWAQYVCDRYLTGTAVTVIAVVLIIAPTGTLVGTCIRRCRVCDAMLLRRGKFCHECGSRV